VCASGGQHRGRHDEQYSVREQVRSRAHGLQELRGDDDRSFAYSVN